jgi:hypothetical protein
MKWVQWIAILIELLTFPRSLQVMPWRVCLDEFIWCVFPSRSHDESQPSAWLLTWMSVSLLTVIYMMAYDLDLLYHWMALDRGFNPSQTDLPRVSKRVDVLLALGSFPTTHIFLWRISKTLQIHDLLPSNATKKNSRKPP